MSIFQEDEDLDAHTFRVLAPSLVPSVPAGSRSSAPGHPRAYAAYAGSDGEEEISRLRKELHLDVRARSPVMSGIEDTFGRYANRASPVRSRPHSRDQEHKIGTSTGHPRRQLTRAAALGMVPSPTDDAQQLTAVALDEARRQADERVSAAVAAVRREAEEQLARMQADLDARVREMATQMAAAQLDRAREEAVEQVRAELKARDFTMRPSRISPPLRLIRAFRGWQARITWCRRARGLLAKAARRMHSLHMACAWTKWCDDTRRIRMGRRALARLVHTKLSRAFERWRHILVAKIEARAQLQTGDVLLLEAKRVDDQRKSHLLSTHLLSLQAIKSYSPRWLPANSIPGHTCADEQCR